MASTAFPNDLDTAVKNAKNNELSYRALHYSAVITDEETETSIEVPFLSYTSKYRDYFDKLICKHKFTDYDVAIYRFRPKAWSYALYGTTEFWNDLLVINNFASIKDFDPVPGKWYKYYSQKYIKSYVNEFMILEGAYI